MEFHVEVHNCQTYTGKTSIAELMYASFKPLKINSHGVPGFLVMRLKCTTVSNYCNNHPLVPAP
jgi:hypothetical protein